VAAELAAVVAQARQFQFRYLSSFGPMAISLPAEVHADTTRRIEALRSQCNLLGAGVRMGCRGWKVAELEVPLTAIRRTFDEVSRIVLTRIADGPVHRLLHSDVAGDLLASLRALLRTPPYSIGAGPGGGDGGP
jgi:hypothetical protein